MGKSCRSQILCNFAISFELMNGLCKKFYASFALKLYGFDFSLDPLNRDKFYLRLRQVFDRLFVRLIASLFDVYFGAVFGLCCNRARCGFSVRFIAFKVALAQRALNIYVLKAGLYDKISSCDK